MVEGKGGREGREEKWRAHHFVSDSDLDFLGRKAGLVEMSA